MKTGYIYYIKNKFNNKGYVGQTVQRVQARWNAHRSFKCGGGRSAIKQAIKKYGSHSFEYYVLEECSLASLNSQETYWINLLLTMAPNGYNLRTGGTFGYIYSPETRHKMSLSRLGKIPANKGKQGLVAIDLDDRFTISFSGAYEAELAGFEKSSIYNVINGKYKQYQGLRWSYG